MTSIGSKAPTARPALAGATLLLCWFLGASAEALRPPGAVPLVGGSAGDSEPEAVALLEGVRKLYAGLESYSDHGTVEVEFKPPGAPALIERHRFETSFRGPRGYRFVYHEDESAGGDVVAIWCDGGDFFESWWSATGIHDRYPRGQGANAFALTAFQTRSTALGLAPLLFPGAGLVGALENLEGLRVEGRSEDRGRSLITLTAVSQLGYQTGHGGERRPIRITLDTESRLVTRIVRGTPEGAAAGSVDRVDTRFEPQANPPIEAHRLHFEVPVGGR